MKINYPPQIVGYRKPIIITILAGIGAFLLIGIIYVGTHNAVSANHESLLKTTAKATNQYASSGKGMINDILDSSYDALSQNAITDNSNSLNTNVSSNNQNQPNNKPNSNPPVQVVVNNTPPPNPNAQIIAQFKQQELQQRYQDMVAAENAGIVVYAKSSSSTLALTNLISNTTNKAQSNTSNNNVATAVDAVVPVFSPYVINAGAIIPSTLITGINSDLSGEVSALVRENVYDSKTGKYLLIPQGSKLVGQYSNKVLFGQERLMVAWTRIIYPDGRSVYLDAMPGTSLEGYSGFYDQVNNHYFKIFGTSFIIGVISAAMQIAQEKTSNTTSSGGVTITQPTMGQTLAGSLAQQLGQTSLAVANKGLNIAPTITIRAGYEFNIMLTADLNLKPYKIFWRKGHEK